MNIIWNYFQVPPEKPEEQQNKNVKVMCKICYATLSTPKRTTSNLHKHMRRKHAEIYSQAYPKFAFQKQSQIDDIFEASSSVVKLENTDSSNSAQMESLSSADNALLMYLVCDLVPVSTLESSHFKNLLTTLDPTYKIPSTKKFSEKLLQQKHFETKLKSLHDLKFVKSLCVTVDVWKSGNCTYLGILGHYMEDWSKKLILLSWRRFSHECTAVDVGQEYAKIVQWFGLGQKTCCLITDNVASYHIKFSLKNLQQSVCFDSDSGKYQWNNEVESKVCSNSQMYRFLPKFHTPCFEYSLELVALDGFTTNKKLLTLIEKLIMNLLVSHKPDKSATSGIKVQKIEQNRCAQRWNLDVKMIKSFLSISDETLALADLDFSVNSDEKSVLKDLLQIIEPLEEAADHCFREEGTSAGYVIPCIRGLRHHFTQVESEHNADFVRSIAESIEKHLTCYEECDFYKLAAVLDARFKLSWCQDESERYWLRQELMNELSALPTSALISPKNMIEEPEKKKSKLFSFMNHSFSESSAAHSNLQLETEVQNYLEQPCVAEDSNSLEYWKFHKNTFPNLTSLSEKYLAAPTSFNSTYNYFSFNNSFNLDNCQLTDDSFEPYMFIKCNNQFQDVVLKSNEVDARSSSEFAVAKVSSDYIRF